MPQVKGHFFVMHWVKSYAPSEYCKTQSYNGIEYLQGGVKQILLLAAVANEFGL